MHINTACILWGMAKISFLFFHGFHVSLKVPECVSCVYPKTKKCVCVQKPQPNMSFNKPSHIPNRHQWGRGGSLYATPFLGFDRQVVQELWRYGSGFFFYVHNSG